jgi:hypothetical protein
MVADVLLPTQETEIDARKYDDERGEVVCFISCCALLLGVISFLDIDLYASTV